LEAGTPLAQSIEGLPLGLIEGTDYIQVAVRIQPDDLLILYTDGVTEASNRNGEMLERDGLLAIFRSLSMDEPARMANVLIGRLREFRDGTAPDDDCTFCILQRTD